MGSEGGFLITRNDARWTMKFFHRALFFVVAAGYYLLLSIIAGFGRLNAIASVVMRFLRGQAQLFEYDFYLQAGIEMTYPFAYKRSVWFQPFVKGNF
jgi:hypothetical protein